MCTVVKETYDEFIAGQVLKYAGFVSEEGSVGNFEAEGNHFALITYWKSFEAHEESHRAELFLKAFGGVMEFCSETKELGLRDHVAREEVEMPIFVTRKTDRRSP